MQSVLGEQHIGIQRKVEEFEAMEVKPSAQQKSIGLTIRLHTSSRRGHFESLQTACTHQMYRMEAFRSHQPWTLYSTFLKFAAYTACSRKYGAAYTDTPVDEGCTLDAIAYFPNEDEEHDRRAAAPTDENVHAEVTSHNQKDDWLHRGDCIPLNLMPIFLYGEVVTRLDMPRNKMPIDLKYSWWVIHKYK